MPLDMPESVLVRYTGTMQPGVTLRDLVHAIPLYAIKAGLLTVAKAGKKNVFSGRILEIEGLPDLKVEQAFELSDASAERSAAGCTIKLSKEPIIEYLNSNVVLMKNMIADGYADAKTLARRIEKVEAWLAKPELLEADADAEYAAVIEIDLNELKEPVLCCPNDPDDAKLLSEVAGTKIDEAFIGSCMTNIGHFRAAAKLLGGQRDIPVKLWVAPPTKMDQSELIKEGHYAAFGTAGARTEMPGCSLCMGNQAQVREGATVVSTSTRNFPNRLGKNTNVFLASAELAAIASRTVIIELKTTVDASPLGFPKQSIKYGYHVQTSYYLTGHERATGQPAVHVTIAVESDAPYAVALYTPDDSTLLTGSIIWRRYLDMYAECVKTGRWPGYADRIETLSLPSWAHRTESETND
jgi:aconitate hydratase 2/2-methylisocitrate dehydratase